MFFLFTPLMGTAIEALDEVKFDIASMDCLKAYKKREYKIVLQLLDKNPETCLSTRSPINKASLLYCAAGHLRLDDVKIFLERYSINDSAWVDAYGNTPIHYACLAYIAQKSKGIKDDVEASFIAIIKAFVKKNPFIINESNEHGIVPLHILVGHDVDESIFELFWECKASFEVRDNDGQTPLHCACKYQKERILLFLMSQEDKLSPPRKSTPDTPSYMSCGMPVSKKKSLDSFKERKRLCIVDCAILDKDAKQYER